MAKAKGPEFSVSISFVALYTGICSEIEKLTQGCPVRQEKQNANVKELLLP